MNKNGLVDKWIDGFMMDRTAVESVQFRVC